MAQGLLDAALVLAYSDALSTTRDSAALHDELPDVVLAPRLPLPGPAWHRLEAPSPPGCSLHPPRAAPTTWP